MRQRYQWRVTFIGENRPALEFVAFAELGYRAPAGTMGTISVLGTKYCWSIAAMKHVVVTPLN